MVASDGEGSKRPANTPFKQQTLKAWRPILTPKAVIIAFAAIGVIFVPIGAVILVSSSTVVEQTIPDYHLTCADGVDENGSRIDRNPCNVSMIVEKDMHPPIYVYYKLTNYYQNHRRYVKSRNEKQLRGDVDILPKTLEEDCAPKYYYEPDSPTPFSPPAGFGRDSENNDLAHAISPCGLIAWSYFNDSFFLKRDGVAFAPEEISHRGIAWATDVSTRYKNSEDGSTGMNYPPFDYYRKKTCADTTVEEWTAEQLAACTAANSEGKSAGWCFPGSGFCVEDEHFMVWMRTAGLPTFRKTYAIINTPITAGTEISVVISNGHYRTVEGVWWNSFTDAPQTTLYPVTGFQGTKSVVLSTTEWVGGKNDFLGVAYVVVGVICLVLAMGFTIKDRCSPRKEGDAAYLRQKGEK
jgi:hypothetical protein